MTDVNQETEAPELSALESAIAIEESYKSEDLPTEGTEVDEGTQNAADVAPGDTEGAPGVSEPQNPANPPVDSSEPSDVDTAFQSKFDDLLSRERGLRERETVVKTAEESGLDMNSITALAKADPVAFLEKFGIEFDDIADNILDTYDTDPKVKSLEDRLAVFEQDKKDRLAQDEQVALQSQMKEYVTALHDHIDKSDYEITKVMGDKGLQMVQTLLVNHWKETGTEMDVDEACKVAEGWFVENELPKMEKLLATRKGQEKFGKRDTVAAPIVPKTSSQTLSNQAATIAPRRKADDPEETALDRAIRVEEELKRNT